MTRSDLMLDVERFCKSSKDREAINLIRVLHNKVEKAYEVIFILEKDDHLRGIGSILRSNIEG